MFATNRFVTSACSGQFVTSRLRNITSWHMFVTVNVSFNAYACHEVHFVAKFIWSRTYVPKSSRHEVTFHQLEPTLNKFQTLNQLSQPEIRYRQPMKTITFLQSFMNLRKSRNRKPAWQTMLFILLSKLTSPWITANKDNTFTFIILFKQFYTF